MKLAILISLSLGCLIAAPDLIIGTWKLNRAKSDFGGAILPQSLSSFYTKEGDWITGKYSGIDGDGKPVESTHRYKQDGKEYPSRWGSRPGTLSVTTIDDHTAEVVIKLEDGAITKRRRVISADGKTMTFTDSGKDAKGKSIQRVLVWER